MSAELTFLQAWYESQCDQDWEHEFGVRIATVDNPGWHLEVDLVGTALEGIEVQRTKVELPHGRWLWWWSDGRIFHATADALSLSPAIAAFRDFAAPRSLE